MKYIITAHHHNDQDAAMPQSQHVRAAARHRCNPALRALLLAAGALVAARAQAGDLYVACGPGVTISMAEVRDVFLGEKQFAGSTKLAPVDNSAVQADFLDKVMKMDAGKYTAAWTKKSFRDGSTPPPVKGSDAEVSEYLKHTPGGCGYLGSAPPGGLTLVGKL